MDGYILVLAILILGGTIATLGDRIGSKVGKARLSIFNLRPRRTATIVTIATGGLISASTLAIMLATSSQLREGLFQLENIRNALKSTQAEKLKAEKELSKSRSERDIAQLSLDRINKSLAQSLLRQSQTQKQLESVQEKFQEANDELLKVQEQEKNLRDRIQTLTTEQETLVAEGKKLQLERDRLVGDLEKITQERENLRKEVVESQARFDALEKQRVGLQAEVQSLTASRERLIASIQTIRKGNIAILSEQVLATGVIKPNLSSQETRNALFQLLRQADQFSRELLSFLPGKDPQEPVVKITESQINNLLERVKDGRSYVIRILSAGNYIRQETSVNIAADVTPNKQIFHRGEVIVSLPFSPNLPPQELEARVGQLFVLASFRARREGVLEDPITGKVGSFSPAALSELLKAAGEYKSNFEIQAVAKEPIFTASTLTLELVLLANGVEVRRFS